MQWFRHNSNARSDPKLLALGREHGPAGLIVWWNLCEVCCSEEGPVSYHKGDNELLARILNLEPEWAIDLPSILDTLAELSLIKRGGNANSSRLEPSKRTFYMGPKSNTAESQRLRKQKERERKRELQQQTSRSEADMSHVTPRDGHALDNNREEKNRNKQQVAKDDSAEQRKRVAEQLQQHPDLSAEQIDHGLDGLSDAIVKGTSIANEVAYALKVARGYVPPPPRPEDVGPKLPPAEPCPHGQLPRFCKVCGPPLIEARRNAAKDILTKHQLGYALLVTLFAVVGGGLLVESFERGVEDANITSLPDGIWWAVTTVTTVGYGDRFPVTAGGRAIAGHPHGAWDCSLRPARWFPRLLLRTSGRGGQGRGAFG